MHKKTNKLLINLHIHQYFYKIKLKFIGLIIITGDFYES